MSSVPQCPDVPSCQLCRTCQMNLQLHRLLQEPYRLPQHWIKTLKIIVHVSHQCIKVCFSSIDLSFCSITNLISSRRFSTQTRMLSTNNDWFLLPFSIFVAFFCLFVCLTLRDRQKIQDNIEQKCLNCKSFCFQTN